MAIKTIYDARYKNITSTLINVRKSSGLTQTELAKKLKRPQSYVAKYENNERRLDVVELIDICSVLKVNIIDIIKQK